MSIDATRATWKLTAPITAIQKLILLSLADRAGEDGECWPSIPRLEADTNLNRKTLIDNRKKLIALGLIELTGEMMGKKKQIPVMRLTYVKQREQEFTSTENGMRTSTEFGTRTSTENGTLNLKEESKKRNICESVDSPFVNQEKNDYDVVNNKSLVEAFIEKFPYNPHPNPKNINKELVGALNSLKKRWIKDITKDKPLTLQVFKNYLDDMVTINYWMTDVDRQVEMIAFVRYKTVDSVISRIKALKRKQEAGYAEN
jgi:hypothetical protein